MEKSIIAQIKEKKELSGLDHRFVESVLQNYMKKNKIQTFSEKEKKIIISDVRKELRKFSGRFQLGKSFNKTEFHISTKERRDSYITLKNLIKKLNPKSILDLGCGLNPLIIAKPGIEYYASDINSKELEAINSFFKKEGIKGNAFYCDLRDSDCQFPKVDLCLILKVLDIIEEKGHKTAENIIKKLECKNIIVSFPTIKLSGKRMNNPKRAWFEKMLSRLSLKFEKTESNNEIFYLIGK